MTRAATALALALLLAIGSSAGAAKGFITGNDLHGICQASSGLCKFYVVGVVDAMLSDVGGSVVPLCIPAHLTIEQMGDIVALWLEHNPDKRHYTAASTVLVALRGVIECAP